MKIEQERRRFQPWDHEVGDAQRLLHPVTIGRLYHKGDPVYGWTVQVIIGDTWLDDTDLDDDDVRTLCEEYGPVRCHFCLTHNLDHPPIQRLSDLERCESQEANPFFSATWMSA